MPTLAFSPILGKLKQVRKTNPAFTLMELLIVIGVLGILAAGLLAAIDPFEQLKKSIDTNNRSAAIELLSSLQRFYASHGDFPWHIATYSATCGTDSGQSLDGLGPIVDSAMTVQFSNLAACITSSLIADGELKSSYFKGIGATNIYIGSDLTNKTDVTVCFEPHSKSNMDDPSSKYLVNTVGGNRYSIVLQTGTPPLTACPRQIGDCAQCFK